MDARRSTDGLFCIEHDEETDGELGVVRAVGVDGCDPLAMVVSTTEVCGDMTADLGDFVSTKVTILEQPDCETGGSAFDMSFALAN